MPLHSYTLDELVSEAHRAGNPNATRRLARSWVGLGLLDESEKGPSRGRGRGIPRYWSEHQKDLFLLLLRNQAGGARRTETLCNIPVSWWIYRGDPFVPLRQAKRALRTWFAKTRRESWQRSTHSALELIGAHLPPLPLETRDKIMSEIARITYTDSFDPESLRTKLRDLGGPANAITRGDDVHYITDWAVARTEAILYARELLNTTPDQVYRFARTELTTSIGQYATIQPHLATRPDIGHLATPLTPEDQGRLACPHLAMILGHLLIAGDKLRPALRQGTLSDADAA